MIKADLQFPRGSASIHLDALRGMAAFLVLLSHWRDAFFVDYSALPSHNPLTTVAYLLCGMGHQWVIVFFVLSGYLVGGSVLRSFRDGCWSWRAYLLTRLTRLYVVLLPALLLGGIADWMGMHSSKSIALYAGRSGMGSLATNVHLTFTPRVFIECLFFLQNLHAPNFGSNSVLWSLANEFWYYLTFPLLVLAFTRTQKPFFRAACILALVAWSVFAGMHVVILAIPWLLGVLIAWLPKYTAPSWMRHLALLSAVTLFTAGMILFSIGQVTGDLKHFPVFGLIFSVPVTDFPLSLIVFFLIWVIVHCAIDPVPSVYAWLAKRAASGSYTLYLVHFPILVLLKSAFQLPRAFPAWSPMLASMAVLAIIVLYGQVVYELFEKNTATIRKWIKPYVMGKPATEPVAIGRSEVRLT
jgi:peptidoglycan/LPS O-acetylase OafA/YrhL